MIAQTYMPQAPCKNGHMAPRYASTRCCCECDSIKLAKYRNANREKLRTAARSRSEQRPHGYKHPNSKKWAADFYDRNKDKCSHKSKVYQQSNKEKYAIYARTRRARVRAVGGVHTENDIVEIFQMQKGRCAYCRTKVKFDQKRVDHIIPIARDGHNGRSNLQILCEPCNVRKSAIDPIEYAQRIGRLI